MRDALRVRSSEECIAVFWGKTEILLFSTAYSTGVKISGTQRNILISYDKITILYLHQTYYNIVMVFWR